MLQRYEATVRALTDEEKEYLRNYFKLDPAASSDLYSSLNAARLCQADVVLALLRGGFTATVNNIVTITHVPARPPLPLPQLPHNSEPRVHRITFPTRRSPRVLWLHRLRCGMTKADIIGLGKQGSNGAVRWLRWALRNKYLEFR